MRKKELSTLVRVKFEKQVPEIRKKTNVLSIDLSKKNFKYFFFRTMNAPDTGDKLFSGYRQNMH